MSERNPMAANDTDLAKVQAWINEKAVRKTCPLCEHNHWSASKIVELRQFFGGPLAETGGVVPTVLVVCQNCGYMMLLNAGIIGLLER